MLANDDSEILSDVEIILPIDIIETCMTLKPDSLSCFMSVNETSKTTNQVTLHKLNDDSVRIRVTGKIAQMCIISRLKLMWYLTKPLVKSLNLNLNPQTSSFCTKSFIILI